MRPVSEQRLGKHVPVATVTHVTGETGCCLRGPRRGVIKKRAGATSQLSSTREAEKRWRYSSVDSEITESSVRYAVKIEPESVKLKNLHC
jgi:hypothetical protein